MRISKYNFVCVMLGLVVAVVVAATTPVRAETVTFRSTDDALRQGISAYNGGYYELALPALEAVARRGGGVENPSAIVARFYTAEIYSDNDGSYTDHVKAFALYRALSAELRNVDPVDNELAPIAAKSLTALSRYLRRGLAAARVASDVNGADSALYRAAITFNDEDAQFELAKVLLRGEGADLRLGRGDDPARRIANARHWLSQLSRTGHAGAQAFLADLLWRGKFVEKDQAAALNLIDVAVANAPPQERVWIEDIYQNIFCNAGEGVREQATGRVADWRSRYGRSYTPRVDVSGLAALTAAPVRTCANGEMVRPIDRPIVTPAAQPQLPDAIMSSVPGTDDSGNAPAAYRGDAGSIDIPAIGQGFGPGLSPGLSLPSFQQQP